MLISTGARPDRESAKVPSWISQPRSAVSNANRLLKAAEGLGLMTNPMPDGVQDTVSILGAGFAAFNVGAELYDGDWVGALEDTASGSVSLLGGVKLLTDSAPVVDGVAWAGAALNGAFAVRDFRQGKTVEGALKVATATGLGLGTMGSPVAQSVGLAILGTSGLIDLAYGHLGPQDKGKKPAQPFT